MSGTLASVLLSYFLTYGLIIIFISCVLGGLIIGKFLPTEILVPTAVILEGGSVQWAVLVLVVAVTGSVVGQTLLFRLVRREGGDAVVSSPRVRINRAHIDTVEAYFERYGLAAVAVTNMFPLVRSWITFPAALSGTEMWKFVVATTLGNTVYHGFFIVAAVSFGVVIS